MQMGLTLQDVFCQHYPDYEHAHPLPLHVRKAAQAIMQCRTAALGGHIQACPEGHFSRIWYNSCRHRACPQCAFIQTERWLTAQQARLLACDHYHVIFTLPHDLNALWLSNVETLSQILFHSARETLFELLGDTKYLGAKPGLIAALHKVGPTTQPGVRLWCCIRIYTVW
jgi:Transposase zinc-binding domain